MFTCAFKDLATVYSHCIRRYLGNVSAGNGTVGPPEVPRAWTSGHAAGRGKALHTESLPSPSEAESRYEKALAPHVQRINGAAPPAAAHGPIARWR